MICRVGCNFLFIGMGLFCIEKHCFKVVLARFSVGAGQYPALSGVIGGKWEVKCMMCG